MKKLKVQYKNKFIYKIGEAVMKVYSKKDFSVIKKNWFVVKRYKIPTVWYENWYKIKCKECGTIIKYPETRNINYVFGECKDKHKHYG